MPDKNGKISPDEFTICNEKFEAYEKQLGRDLPCEVCGGIVWRLNGHMVMVMGDSAKGLLGSRVRVPLLNYFCTTCGNMKFFSAPMWGLTIEAEKPDDPPAPGTEGGASNGD